MSEFPILWNHNDELGLGGAAAGGLLRNVPWAFVQPLEDRAQAQHGQSLRQLANRGGLSANEVLALIEGRRYPNGWIVPTRLASDALRRQLEAWRLDQAGDAGEARDASAYALALIAEECGEAIQIAGKALRFGLDTPQAPGEAPSARDRLALELGDVLAAIEYAAKRKVIDPDAVFLQRERKLRKLFDPGQRDNLGRRLAP